jgi:hypothetical protein
MKLLKTFEATTKPAMRNTILNSLGCTRDSEMLSSFFLYAIDSENSLTLDERNRILASANNQGASSIKALIDFARENSKEISKFDLLSRVLSSIASRIATRELLDDFHSLLESLESSGEVSQEEKQRKCQQSGLQQPQRPQQQLHLEVEEQEVHLLSC